MGLFLNSLKYPHRFYWLFFFIASCVSIGKPSVPLLFLLLSYFSDTCFPIGSLRCSYCSLWRPLSRTTRVSIRSQRYSYRSIGCSRTTRVSIGSHRYSCCFYWLFFIAAFVSIGSHRYSYRFYWLQQDSLCFYW